MASNEQNTKLTQAKNMREPIAGSGTQQYAQISADESATIQAGINSMVGQNVQGTDSNGPYSKWMQPELWLERRRERV